MLHSVGDDVTEPTATSIMRKGYRHGERLLRPALVGVTEPGQAPAGDDETAQN